ncbi:hypothetical protein SynA1528_00320 [Synechococcus sp. A15-28]|nr:hypothetical protein SynA1528_00320 [Synechococcus sp. A15-28]
MAHHHSNAEQNTDHRRPQRQIQQPKPTHEVTLITGQKDDCQSGLTP